LIFLWLIPIILVVGIIIYFKVKKSKVKQEELLMREELEKVETDEGLPKLKFGD
jgi:cytochrome c-type biogenesis protein CcmH/NrfF